MTEKVTGILLAGGKSSRFGSNKALTIFNGQPLINYGLSLLREVCSNIIISSNTKQLEHLGFPVVSDEIKGIGPMGGIYACLKQSKSSHNIVISCDTPFLNTGLLKYILKHKKGFEVVIPETEDGFLEPLAAYYHSDIHMVMKDLILAEKYKMQFLMDLAPTLRLPIGKNLEFYDTNLFYNINWPEDLNKINDRNQ